MNTTLLFIPVNQAELDLIRALNWSAFPPLWKRDFMLDPHFDENAAHRFALTELTERTGAGFVLRVEVQTEGLDLFEVNALCHNSPLQVRTRNKGWEKLNQYIVGEIQLLASYFRESEAEEL